MRLVGRPERRKVLLVGPLGCDPIGKARELANECRLWEGREQDIGYAQRVAGLKLASHERSPFRAPHHTVGLAAMMGKMTTHRWSPGEMSLAHGGVLLLHQAPEFTRQVLESVQGAWTQKRLTFSSSVAHDVPGHDERNQILVPTVFTLVMSATPCPCGYRGAAGRTCDCTERQVERWFAALAPLTEDAERIDLPGRVVT